MPILLEGAPHSDWAPVPPHLSSHWSTISGQDLKLDPPDRIGVIRPTGRRSFHHIVR